MPIIKSLSRRQLIQLAAAGIAAPSVIVIGGGFGGSAAAKYLKRYNGDLNVTLIEPNKTYVTCPGSNWVIGGFTEMTEITHN